MWMEPIRVIWVFKDYTALEDRSERPRTCKNRFCEFYFCPPSSVYCQNENVLDWALPSTGLSVVAAWTPGFASGTVGSSLPPTQPYTRMPQRPEPQYILSLCSSHQHCWKEVTWKWDGKKSFLGSVPCSAGPPGTWYADGSRLVVMFDINQEVLPVFETAVGPPLIYCSFQEAAGADL